MQLQSFRVTNYRNILDSGDVEAGRVIALVGQNECGKSNLLSALNGLNAFDGSGYTLHQDWPIDRWPPPAEPATVCAATFHLDPEDITAVFNAAVPKPSDGALALTPPDRMSILVSKNYANKIFIDLGEWRDKLDLDKAAVEIQKRLPKCVYIDDYAIFNGSHQNFPDLYNRINQRQQVAGNERTLLIALDLAALNLGQLTNADANQRTFFTTASSSTLTRRFANKWRQRPVQFDIRVDGSNLMIYVLDEGLGAPIPLERRSAGFRWYVSFIWRFTHASNGEFKNCILLLDEPGVRLHHAGHADLLAFLNALSETNAVLYTTHLATMIDPAYPERVRIMEVHEHHGQVLNSIVSNQQKPMMVIEAALGLAGRMSGLLGARQNLIVEGVDDMLTIQKLSGVLRASGETSLSDRIFLIPADGASKTPMFAAFMIGNGFDAGVLVDNDAAGDEAIAKIKNQRVSTAAAETKARFKYLQLGEAIGVDRGREFAIEDIFPVSFYLECVNEAYGTNLIESNLAETGSAQIVKRVEHALRSRGRIADTLDKRLVMAAIQNRFNAFTDVKSLPGGTAEKAKKLIAVINRAFQ